MSRERVSTTVDRERLMACRRLLGTRDSELFDLALAALLEGREGARQPQALTVVPDHGDADLGREGFELSSLPYDGEIPEAVQRLAAARRR